MKSLFESIKQGDSIDIISKLKSMLNEKAIELAKETETEILVDSGFCEAKKKFEEEEFDYDDSDEIQEMDDEEDDEEHEDEY